MTNTRAIRALTIVGVLSIMLFGCEKEGPAERFGKQIDHAVEQAKEDLRKAKKSIEERAGSDKSVEQAVEEIRVYVLETEEQVENAMKQ